MMARSKPYGLPCMIDCGTHSFAMTFCDIAGGRRRIGKLGLRVQSGRQRFIPNVPGDIPGMTTDSHGRKIERVIRDARIDMYTAIVVGAVIVGLHMGRLRVLAEQGIVVCRTWCLH